MKNPSKKLPAANEFSPGQLGGIAGLRKLLALVAANANDADAAKEAVRKEFFATSALSLKSDPPKRLKQQLTRAYNAVLGASEYGLVDLAHYELTKLGTNLLNASGDHACAELLATSILKERRGLEVLDAINGMQARGDRVTKTSLQGELEHRGFELPRATTHHTKLVGWLRQAGVVKKRYEVDDARVGELAGVTVQAGKDWQALTSEQRAFLAALKKLSLVHGVNPIQAKAVTDAVVLERGPIFTKPDQLKKTVFEPLDENGWLIHGGVGKGRGGKSGTVTAAKKLLESDLGLLPEEAASGIPAELQPLLETPLEGIYEDLKSSSKHKKGIALELLALRLAMDIGLLPVRMRERSASTGGAEVDLIADAVHLHFSRWLIQCKNTKKVTVAALAKEIGMATLLRAQVIVLVTTGSFSAPVVEQAALAGATTPLQVILVPGSVIEQYQAEGANALRYHFYLSARQALELKRGQAADGAGKPS